VSVAVDKAGKHRRLTKIDLASPCGYHQLRTHLFDLLAANQNVLVFQHAAGVRFEQFARVDDFHFRWILLRWRYHRAKA
jgi:hypothetical protein